MKFRFEAQRLTPLARELTNHISDILGSVNFKELYETVLASPSGVEDGMLTRLAEIITLIGQASSLSCQNKLPAAMLAELMAYHSIILKECELRRHPLSVSEALYVIVYCDSIVNHFASLCGHAIPESRVEKDREDPMFSGLYC